MQVVPGGQACSIKTKRHYDIDELFEIMRNGKIEEKFGPIERVNDLMSKLILVQGLKGFTNEVSTSGKGIIITQAKRTGLLKETLINVATLGVAGKVKDIKGWAHMVGLDGAKDNKEVMKALAEEIEKLVEVKTGGCYVATCIYGSYNCPEVWTLRRYRDYRLSTSWFGKKFIQIYYTVSPKVVELFGNKKWFSIFLKPFLNRFVRKLQKSGIDSSPYSDSSTIRESGTLISPDLKDVRFKKSRY
jgi:hypothetical protein